MYVRQRNDLLKANARPHRRKVPPPALNFKFLPIPQIKFT